MAIAEYTPLSEATDRSEMITVESLGLPDGFDQDRLGIDIGRVETSLRWSGIRHLTLDSHFDAETHYEEIRGTLKDRKIVGRSNYNDYLLRQQAVVEYVGTANLDEERTDYQGAIASITSYTNPRNMSLKASLDRWPEGAEDPEAQAFFANDALQKGLKEAAKDKLVLPRRGVADTAKGLGRIIAFHPQMIQHGHVTPAILLTPPLVNAVDALYEAVINGRSVRDRQWSMFFGISSYDRLALARYHAGKQLVKVLP